MTRGRMRWIPCRRRMAGAGVPTLLWIVGGALALLVLVLVVVVGGWAFRERETLGVLQTALESRTLGEYRPGRTRVSARQERDQAELIRSMVDDLDRTWSDIFAMNGYEYRKPDVVAFVDAIDVPACDAKIMLAAYCAMNETIYVDVAAFEYLSEGRRDSSGMARGMVVGHEFAHHLQQLLGTFRGLQAMATRDPSRMLGPHGYATLMELQADCLSGVWMHYASGRLSWDIDARALTPMVMNLVGLGDDVIMERVLGEADPSQYSHGDGQARGEWLFAGAFSGDPLRCDTFAGPRGPG